MEQAALRPKPLPGRAWGGSGRVCGKRTRGGTTRGSGDGPARPPGRPGHAVRRRGRRLVSALFAAFVGTVLVLSGVGLGAMGTTVVGTGQLPGPQQRQAGVPGASPSPSRTAASAPAAAAATAPVVARLGVEVTDDRGPGALVVAVHVPGPGHSAGLVRGDVVLALDRARVDTAADLVRAVARARPGRAVKVTVRHRSGGYQQLTAVPAIVT